MVGLVIRQSGFRLRLNGLLRTALILTIFQMATLIALIVVNLVAGCLLVMMTLTLIILFTQITTRLHLMHPWVMTRARKLLNANIGLYFGC